MDDDAIKVLADAGVECAELELMEESGGNSGSTDDVVLALARLVAKYKRQAESHA